MSKANSWMMRPNTLRIGLAAVLMTAASAARAQTEDNPVSARPPRLVVPRVATPPTVDGRLESGEWEGAAAISGFMGATGARGGLIEPTPSVMYAAHDGRRLYIAMRVQLRPGVIPSRRYRRRDEPVYMDNYQFEFWITPPVRGRLESYQFIGNAYGAIFDVRHVPELGIANVLWNGDWEFRNHFVRGEYWSAELAIDFAEFGVERVAPDQVWRGLFAVAWPQRSWPFTHGWYKNVGTHAELVFAEDAAAVRLLDFSSLLENRVAPDLEIFNPGGAANYRWRTRMEDAQAESVVSAPAGAATGLKTRMELPPWPDGTRRRTVELEVTDARNRVLLRGDWHYSPLDVAARTDSSAPAEEKPWSLPARVQFAPLAMGLKIWADVLDYPQRDRLDAVRCLVRRAGETEGPPVSSVEVRDFAYDAAETYIWLPKDLPYGEYEAVIRYVAADGETLAEALHPFRHRDLREEFVWLGSNVAGDIRVRPPFEPVRVEGRKLRVWGRTHEMEGAFPSQITSAGAPMLARPISLAAIIAGRRVEAQMIRPFRLIKSGDEEAVFEGAYTLAGLDLELQGRLAFDGLLHYRLEARPIEGEAGEPVERLFIAMPVKAAHAKYYFSTGGGWNVAIGDTRPTANGGNIVWDSRDTADFVPYVGLTDDDRALQWFADNDHDWALGSEAPCAQIVRENDVVEAQIHLVRRSGPAPAFQAQFGFIASPVRPMPRHWRHTALDSRPLAGSKINFFFGPGHGGTPIDLHDTKKLAEAMKIEIPPGANPDVVLRDLPPTRTEWDMAHLRRVLGGRFDRFASVRNSATSPDPHRTRVCYFYNARMYFEGNRSAAFRAFFPGEWTEVPASGWFHLTPVESYQDFFSFHLDLWFKHWYVPGLYFDEVYLPLDYNVFNGNGKLMPDGSVRPSVALMHQRRYLYRMRELFFLHKQDPFIWVHTSNYMAPHAIAAADIAMYGEDRTPTPTVDIMDTIPSLLFRSLGRGQKFGFVPVWMVMAGRGGPQWGFAGRQTFGWCWMHDVVPEYHTTMAGRHLVALRAGWGIDADDVAFAPFWSEKPPLRDAPPDIIASAWTRPGGRALVMVMNLGRSDVAAARIRLDPEALGLAARFRVLDLESGPAARSWMEMCREVWRQISANAPNTAIRSVTQPANGLMARMTYDPNELTEVSAGAEFQLAVPARDFRTLVIEPQ